MKRTRFTGQRKISERAILECARQDIERSKRSGSRYHAAVKFNCGFFLEGSDEILVKLFNDLDLNQGRKIAQKLKNLEIIVANLTFQRTYPIRVSFNINNWKPTRYQLSSYCSIDIIKAMHHKGYIEMEKGYYFNNLKRETRIWANENLLRLFPVRSPGVGYHPVEFVELWKIEKKSYIHPKTKRLRTKKIRQLIDYKSEETNKIRRLRKVLTQAFEVNNKISIGFVDDGRFIKLNVGMIAKFTNNFRMGGRLYSHGRSYFQKYSKEKRRKITFENNPTIELDYKAIHPYLLYAQEGIQYDLDPYSVVDDRPELRPFLKIILISMINNHTYYEAQRVANNWLCTKKEKLEKQKIRKKIFDLGITKAGSFMDKFFIIHKPISKYLCSNSNTGLKLMYKDARIAVEVINHFVKQNIPILCMHDSFVIEEKYKEELREVMLKTYQKHIGFTIKVE